MQNDEKRIAVFIDFENVAMGVRESKYGNFNIDLVLKRLVEKGKIMVKRAYSDWHRYAEFKRAFHQAAIELIDVPQTRYSGKNSADIRMVVDALDLSYQKEHIDTFVLVSGDSDFSPLVSKLRENGRYVIGMGVKQSSSDLLINNCDEFIFYEDLVRPATTVTVVDPQVHHLSPKKAEAIRLVLETFQALQREGKEVIYGSMIKQTLIRKLPSFNETYYGYPMFSRLLEDAAENQLLKLAKDQKSGGYIVTLPSDGAASVTLEGSTASSPAAEAGVNGSAVAQAPAVVPIESRDRFRRGRWDRGRSHRSDRHGEPSPSSAQPAADSTPTQAPGSELVTDSIGAAPNAEAPMTEPNTVDPIDIQVASQGADPAGVSSTSLESSPVVPGPPLLGAEANAPASISQERSQRGSRRQPRFRRSNASDRASSATKGVEAASVQAPTIDTTHEASTSLPQSVPAGVSDGESVPATAKTAKAPRRRSRASRSNRSGGNKKKSN